MVIPALWGRSEIFAGAIAARRCRVDGAGWLEAAREAAQANGRLLALWGSPGPEAAGGCWIRAALALDPGIVVLELPVAAPAAGPSYPGLEEVFPAAARMQRAVADLLGVRAVAPDQRPWLRHAAWPSELFPLKAAPVPPMAPGGVADNYAFVRVEGDGVHEIAVGPVHAGIIEPGHFRFSVVGEKVLRLEERLGYVHKGIERRFADFKLTDGHRLAARVSGDSAVAFAWAYCQAVEAASECSLPPRAAWLRGLCLEIERIQNHLGDLGALGNDAGFAFGLMQFSRLKEELLRAVHAALGRRYLFDAVVPGGVAVDVTPNAAAALAIRARAIAEAGRELRAIYDAHAGVRDRFVGAGRVTPELARRLGLTGLAGRASGQPFDARLDLRCAPYDQLELERIVRDEGDVAARVAVRFDELAVSCRLVEQLLERLPDGTCRVTPSMPAAGASGVGLVEGWRGPVFVAIEAGPEGGIRRCHPHDPSWQNWPVLEHAIIDNIVPDFPLINKSFNLSYSGHDL